MPRISDNVRFSARRSGSSEVEKYYVETGTTYRQVLEDQLDVVPSKFTLYVNGAEVEHGKLTLSGSKTYGIS